MKVALDHVVHVNERAVEHVAEVAGDRRLAGAEEADEEDVVAAVVCPVAIATCLVHLASPLVDKKAGAPDAAPAMRAYLGPILPQGIRARPKASRPRLLHICQALGNEACEEQGTCKSSRKPRAKRKRALPRRQSPYGAKQTGHGKRRDHKPAERNRPGGRELDVA